MKNLRRFLLPLMLCIILVISAFAFASCKKHEHAYEPTVTPPTCTEQGYTTYKCECGEFYVDNYVPAAHTYADSEGKAPTCTAAGYTAHGVCSVCGDISEKEEIPATGHSYVSKVTTYPGADTEGKREYCCDACGDTYEETINALLFSLPKASDAISALVGAGVTTATFDENTSIILIEEFRGAEDIGSLKTFIALNVAEFSIGTVDGVLEGYINIEYGFADVPYAYDEEAPEAPEEFEAIGSIVVFVNGEALSVELVNGDDTVEYSYGLTEMFYKLFADNAGFEYDDAVEISYILQELGNLAPAIAQALEAFANDINPENLGTVLEGIAAFFGEKAITAETDEDGNTTYSINVACLIDAIANIEELTVAEAIDELYGTGTYTLLAAYISALPEKTAGEIANELSALATGFGVDIRDLYAIVDYFVYYGLGIDLNIESQIALRKNKTVAAIVAELALLENEALDAKTIEESFTSTVNLLLTITSSYTVDDLFNLVTYGDADYEIGGEKYSICAQFKSIVSSIDLATTATVTIDANGIVTSAALGYGEDLDVTFTNTEDGIAVDATVMGHALNVDIAEGSFNAVLTIADVGGFEIDFLEIENEISVYYEDTFDNFASLVMQKNEEGVITYLNADLTLNIPYSYETGEYDETTGEPIVESGINTVQVFSLYYSVNETGAATAQVGLINNAIFINADTSISDSGQTISVYVTTTPENAEFFPLPEINAYLIFEATDAFTVLVANVNDIDVLSAAVGKDAETGEVNYVSIDAKALVYTIIGTETDEASGEAYDVYGYVWEDALYVDYRINDQGETLNATIDGVPVKLIFTEDEGSTVISFIISEGQENATSGQVTITPITEEITDPDTLEPTTVMTGVTVTGEYTIGTDTGAIAISASQDALTALITLGEDIIIDIDGAVNENGEMVFESFVISGFVEYEINAETGEVYVFVNSPAAQLGYATEYTEDGEVVTHLYLAANGETVLEGSITTSFAVTDDAESITIALDFDTLVLDSGDDYYYKQVLDSEGNEYEELVEFTYLVALVLKTAVTITTTP